jgi:hypothetical protein
LKALLWKVGLFFGIRAILKALQQLKFKSVNLSWAVGLVVEHVTEATPPLYMMMFLEQGAGSGASSSEGIDLELRLGPPQELPPSSSEIDLELLGPTRGAC